MCVPRIPGEALWDPRGDSWGLEVPVWVATPGALSPDPLWIVLRGRGGGCHVLLEEEPLRYYVRCSLLFS